MTDTFVTSINNLIEIGKPTSTTDLVDLLDKYGYYGRHSLTRVRVNSVPGMEYVLKIYLPESRMTYRFYPVTKLVLRDGFIETRRKSLVNIFCVDLRRILEHVSSTGKFDIRNIANSYRISEKNTIYMYTRLNEMGLLSGSTVKFSPSDLMEISKNIFFL